MEADLNKALQAKVLHQYKPQDKHELRLRPGDVITEVEKLDQGWCKVRGFHGGGKSRDTYTCMPNAITTTILKYKIVMNSSKNWFLWS